MVAKNLSNLIETSSAAWKESKIAGVQYLSLNTDPNDRQGTFLFRLSPGTRYPKHRHPAGEEIYVLKGDLTVGAYQLKAGSFLYSAPASVHDLFSAKGCVFVQILQKPIQIVPDGQIEEIESLPDILESPSTAPAQDDGPYDPSLRTLEEESSK